VQSIVARIGLAILLCLAALSTTTLVASGQSLLDELIGRALEVERPAKQKISRERKQRSSSQSGWSRISSVNGTGATVCNSEGDLYSCFALRCGKGRGTEFAFLFNVGAYHPDARARIVVDDKVDVTLKLQTVALNAEMVAPYEPVAQAGLIEALKTGNFFTFDPGHRHVFNLSGSGRQIEAALSACEPETQRVPAADVAASATAGPPVPDGSMTHVFMDDDFWGGDYDSGLTNPDLAGIGADTCQLICELDARCVAFTHNSANNVCILKNEIGTRKPFKGATSGIVYDKRALPAPVARSGPKARFVAGLHWRDGDTPASYTGRIREAAVSMGGACDVERGALDALAAALEVQVDVSTVKVGDPISVAWTGNALAERIPAWIVVSGDQPVRFTGSGFHALGPGPLGPFGMETDLERQRALVALYSRAAQKEGAFGIVPLRAGPLNLRISIVGYLRQCKEMVELRSRELDAQVAVADARIVLHDPFGLDVYTSQIEVQKFSRRVRFNAERVLVLDTSDGTEVLERAGTDPRISPTGRFLVVRSNEQSEIIDLVDGAVITRLGDQASSNDLGWFLGDSYVLAARAPWGRVWFAPTFVVGEPNHLSRAAPSAETLRPQDLVDIDQQNNLVRIQGITDGFVADLQDLTFRKELGGVDWEPETSESDEVMIFAGFAGAVAPISGDTGWNAAGQAEFTASTWPAVASSSEDRVPATEGVGIQLAGMRGAVALGDRRTGPGERSVDLSEFGFAIADSQKLQDNIEPLDVSWDDPERERKQAEFDARQARLRDRVGADIGSAGVKLAWMTPTGDFLFDIRCTFIRRDDGDVERHELPGMLDKAQYGELDGKPLWVLRNRCEGGPTGDTQHYTSALMIFDGTRVEGRNARDFLVAEFETMRTAGFYEFQDLPFKSKLIGDELVLIYAPGRGAIALFDLETRAFRFKWEGLQRGDLLEDAELSADGRHVLQVNSDRSFAIYDAADGSLVIEGRQVDGETVFWTRDLRFDSTAEGASFVQLRFPGQAGQYTFQQFETRLRRPGLFAGVMSGEGTTEVAPIVVPPRLDGELSSRQGRIEGSLAAAGSQPLSEIRIYQDGILTDRVPITAGGEVAIDIARLPGARWISAVAADETGLISLPVGRDLGPTDSKPGLHVIAAGVDVYADAKVPPLGLAVRDARKMHETLTGLAGVAVNEATSRLMVDGEATRDAVLAAAGKAADASRPGDNVVFFFAGHGLRGPDGRFYLGLGQTRLADVASTALAWADLAAVLARARGRVTVLLDACHSGIAGTSFSASNDDAVDTLRETIPAGLTILSAAKGREYSAEMTRLGGGVFTVALVEALTVERERTDSNGNGVIEVSELYRAVKDKVRILRAGEQTPWLARNQMIGDFALF